MAIIFTKYSVEPAAIPSRLSFFVLSIQSTKMDLDRVSLWQRTILHRVAERSSRDPYIAELERVRRNGEKERERDKEKKMTEMKEGREIASKRDRNGKTKIERERRGEKQEERRWVELGSRLAGRSNLSFPRCVPN